MPRLTESKGVFRAAAGAAGAAAVVGLALPDSHIVDLLTAASIFALYVVSWAVFCGPALEVSFGHTFFIGSVAYMTALLHTRGGLSPIVCLLFAPVGGACIGLAVAALTFRHRGLYFSMATMALQLTLYRCLFLYSPLFGGEEGIYGIQTIAASRTGAFELTGGAAILGYVISEAFVRSRQGLLLSAVGCNERLAEAIGVPVVQSRALALSLSGALAAIGGALYVFTVGQANVELAGDRLSARIVLLGTLGGPQSASGPALAGIIAYVLDQFLSNSIQYTALAVSVLLLLLVVFVPRGLVKKRPTWRDPKIVPEPRDTSAGRGSFRVRGLRRAFGGVQALSDVTFTFASGSVTGIIGPNGAGKTTLLRVLAGEVKPDSGNVEWGAHVVRGSVSKRAREGLRKTFQHVESFGDLTVREHLAVAMTIHHTSLEEPVLERFLRESAVLRELDETLDQLSPAVARLVDIAMAIAARPRLLLLDEPFAGVSEAEGQAISNAVRGLKSQGTSVVVVEHRLRELFALADRVVVMHHGATIANEVPERVFRNADVLAAYGTQEAAMEI